MRKGVIGLQTKRLFDRQTAAREVAKVVSGQGQQCMSRREMRIALECRDQAFFRLCVPPQLEQNAGMFEVRIHDEISRPIVGLAVGFDRLLWSNPKPLAPEQSYA
jgi:hypothetical protein